MALGICTVCSLLDKDNSIKEVSFCKKCDASFCPPCSTNIARRAKAMAIQSYRNLRKK